MNNNIWLIGAGVMAIDYIKVLKAQKYNFKIIGRGKKSAKECEQLAREKVFIGGLKSYLESHDEVCSHAIVCVGVEQLAETTLDLIKAGVKRILVEKPGGLNEEQIYEVKKQAEVNRASIYIAYNRRFYSSVNKVKEIVKEDGGVTSFNFEFTEWSHKIVDIKKAIGVKEKWFLGNSTHVVDLAFFLGGKPKEIIAFTSGSLTWHPTASIYSGAGVSYNGALFSYQANWEAPGRWGVELLTRKHRIYLRPMEKISMQDIGTIKTYEVEFDESLDIDYKPGLFQQVNCFLNDIHEELCTIDDQVSMYSIYKKIANYSD